MAVTKRSLGRGLAALIPDEEMELFRRVARDESTDVSLTGSATFVRLSSKAQKISSNRNEKASSDKPGISTYVASKNVAGPLSDVSESEKNALIDTVTAPQENALSVHHAASDIAIDDIEPNPYQPRRTFDESELNDLASSLREHGIIQPIVVRAVAGGNKAFQLIAGERRWRAARLAGFSNVPAIVRQVNDLQALELALIENVQRHDISAIDAALAYRRLADEFQLSQSDIAQRVGRSRVAVANTLRLLDLPTEIRTALEDGKISEGHGRAILLARGDGARRALFRRILRDHFSVRDVERLARVASGDELPNDMAEEADAQDTKGAMRNGQSKQRNGRETQAQKDYLADLRLRLQKKLGSRLRIQQGNGGGRLVIEYSSDEELERIVAILDGK